MFYVNIHFLKDLEHFLHKTKVSFSVHDGIAVLKFLDRELITFQTMIIVSSSSDTGSEFCLPHVSKPGAQLGPLVDKHSLCFLPTQQHSEYSKRTFVFYAGVSQSVLGRVVSLHDVNGCPLKNKHIRANRQKTTNSILWAYWVRPGQPGMRPGHLLRMFTTFLHSVNSEMETQAMGWVPNF